jgi:3'-5' exoribonuclease
MSRSKIAVYPLHTLPPGQLADTFAMLAEKKIGTTREGKPYYSCKFRDRIRTVALAVWQDGAWFGPCEKDWQEGHFYKLRCIYGEHEKYGPQIELHNIRGTSEADRQDGFDPRTLVEASRFDAGELWPKLLQLVESEIRDEPLRRLVLLLLDRQGPRLKTLPASDKFYPFAGGWLEHIYSVARTSLFLVNHYAAHYAGTGPTLNRDLVLAGAVLHDLGRLGEYVDDSAAPQPSVPGRLIGHVILGRDMVREAAREVNDLNPELLQLLEHVILTHLSLPEWGSPRLPLIPEVLILHHADDLDAKMEMYHRCLSRDQSPGPFTAPDPILKKPLLKRRGV